MPILKGSLGLEEYNVVIEDAAEKDLISILTYISETLHEPIVAERIFLAIQHSIEDLDHRPFRFQLVNDERFAAIGVRKFQIENYLVFYLADEKLKTVHILRIMYARREWQNIL